MLLPNALSFTSRLNEEEKDIVEFVAPGSFERSEAVALKFSRKSI